MRRRVLPALALTAWAVATVWSLYTWADTIRREREGEAIGLLRGHPFGEGRQTRLDALLPVLVVERGSPDFAARAGLWPWSRVEVEVVFPGAPAVRFRLEGDTRESPVTPLDEAARALADRLAGLRPK